MNVEDEFIPDFKLECVEGIIATRSSKLVQKGIYSFVSVYDRIIISNIRSDERILTVGTRNELVTAFCVNKSKIVIGYDDGVIEIVEYDLMKPEVLITSHIMKIHKKWVSGITCNEDWFISVAGDGQILQYDFVVESVFRYGENNTQCKDVKVHNGLVCVLCGDKTIRIWGVNSHSVFGAFAFDDYVCDYTLHSDEMLVIERSGNSYLVNLKSGVRKKFDVFRNVRSLVHRGNVVAVHTKNRLLEYKITKEECFGLVCARRENVSKTFLQAEIAENEIVFLTSANGIDFLSGKQKQIVHMNEVVDIKIVAGLVYSSSKEKIIVWEVGKEDIYAEIGCGYEANEFETHGKMTLGVVGWIERDDEIISFDIFGGYLVVGSGSGLHLYVPDSLEYYRTTSPENIFGGSQLTNRNAPGRMAIEKISGITGHNDCLAVVGEKTVCFLNNSFEEENRMSSAESIVHAKFSPLGNFFCTSTYDNKINVYSFPELDLVLSLYVHSLPVRCFAISPDGSLLASCSADKTVKLWGLKYGECKKSHICDSYAVSFVGDGLFLCAGKTISYYSQNSKLTEWNSYGGKAVCATREYFVAGFGCGIGLYSCNKYEFMAEEVEEAVEYPEIEAGEIDKYEEFLRYLEKSNGGEYGEEEQKRFYKFLLLLNAVEWRNYFYILDAAAVNTILELLKSNISCNVVANARIFITLYQLHTAVLTYHPLFRELKEILLVQAKDLRNTIGTNEGRIVIDINYEDIY